MKPDMRELDKLVEKVIPEKSFDDYKTAREFVAAAIIRDVLCEPMPVDGLCKIAWDTWNNQLTFNANILNVCQAIHQAQMRRKT